MPPRFKKDLKKERIGGKIYYMPPGGFDHATVNANIYRSISRQLKGSLCLPYMENLHLYFEDGSYLVPDILIICDRRQITPNGYNGIPGFIAETLSPSTAKKDRGEKMGLYCKKGVGEYWIVDPRSRSLEIYYLEDGQYILQDSLMLEEDEYYNADTEISLQAFPNVSMHLKNLFEDTL